MMRFVSLWLVLRFDGSLRPPRDTGFPTKGLGRMASSGAAIFADDSLLALGGKSLDIVPGMTSADTEYEGLLMGLEWLSRQDHEWWALQYSSEQTPHITIIGDCRTVIDQLNGISIPRKLRCKHTSATDMIEHLHEKLVALFGNAEIRYEHVLRDENTLCDALCAGVMEILQLKAISDVRIALESSAKPQGQPPLTKALTTHFRDDSLIPYSLRPSLYREASSLAEDMGDAVALKTIGEFLKSEARLWPSKIQSVSEDTPEKESKELLTVEGAKLHIRGLSMLGLSKEADKVKRQHRYLLGRFGDDEQPTFDDQSCTCRSGLSTEHGLVPNFDCVESLSQADWKNPGLRSWHKVAHQTCRNQVAQGQEIWVEHDEF